MSGTQRLPAGGGVSSGPRRMLSSDALESLVGKGVVLLGGVRREKGPRRRAGEEP